MANEIFYVENQANQLVPATFLQMPGTGAYIVDPNNINVNPINSRNGHYYDMTGTELMNFNPNNFLVVPVGFSFEAAIDFGKGLVGQNQTMINFQLTDAFVSVGGLQGTFNLQRSYTDANGVFQTQAIHVPMFQDATSYVLGAVSAQVGMSGDAIFWGGMYNKLLGGQDTSGQSFNNPRNVASINAGAAMQGSFTAPATPTNPPPGWEPSTLPLVYDGQYTVVIKAGDTLSKIVADQNSLGNNITVSDMMKFNGFKPGDETRLQIDQHVMVPQKSGDTLTVEYPDFSVKMNSLDGSYECALNNPMEGTTYQFSCSLDPATGQYIGHFSKTDAQTGEQLESGVQRYSDGDVAGDWTTTHTTHHDDGSYDQDWASSDGSSGTQQQFADGSSTVTRLNADGSSEVTTYDPATGIRENVVTNADGSWTSTQTIYDGEAAFDQSWASSDGSSGTLQERADGSTTQTRNNADGSSEVSTYDAATGVRENTVTDASGNWTTTQTTYQGDGAFEQSWTSSDGSSGVTQQSADGSNSVTRTNADGSSEVVTYDAVTGVRENVVTNADGSWTNTQTTYDGEASFEQSWTSSDGSSGTTQQSADGSSIETRTNADGSNELNTYDAATGVREHVTTDTSGNWTNTETNYHGDGTFDQSWTASDGSSGVTQQLADGSSTLTRINADGSSEVTTYDAAAGKVETISTDVEGNWTSTETNYQGEAAYTQSWTSSDGSSGTTQQFEDGSTTMTRSNADGSSEVTSYDAATGTRESTITDSDGNTFTDSLNVDSSGQKTSEIVSTTNADGSMETVMTDADGDSTFEHSVVSNDGNLDGQADSITTTTIHSDDTITIDQIDYNNIGDKTFESLTTISDGGETTIVQIDAVGDGVFESVFSSVDSNLDGVAEASATSTLNDNGDWSTSIEGQANLLTDILAGYGIGGWDPVDPGGGDPGGGDPGGGDPGGGDPGGGDPGGGDPGGGDPGGGDPGGGDPGGGWDPGGGDPGGGDPGGGWDPGGGDPGGGFCCFPKGTKIRRADGITVAIETVKPGTLLAAPDGRNRVIEEIICVVHPGDKVYSINGQVECTWEQLFLSEDGVWLAVDLDGYKTYRAWKRRANPDFGLPDQKLRQMRAGDCIMQSQGKVTVMALTFRILEQEETMHSFVLEGSRTFIANDYIVESRVSEDCFDLSSCLTSV